MKKSVLRKETTYFIPRDCKLAEAAFVKMMSGLTKSLKAAIYTFNLYGIRDAIIAAKMRGVPIVKVIMFGPTTTGSQAKVHDSLEAARVNVRLFYPKDVLLHDKYTIGDGRHLEQGSANYTLSGFHRNYENVRIVLDDPVTVKKFEDDFDYMWGLAKVEHKHMRSFFRLGRRVRMKVGGVHL